MKKKLILTLLTVSLLSVLFLTGCKNDAAEKFVGEKITAMKKTDTTEFNKLLETGIAVSNVQFTLPFPEELKQPYLDFLQGAFANISFEVSAAEKKDNDQYSINLTFAPIDIKATVKDTDAAYLADMTNPDLTAAASELLKKDAEVINNTPVYKEETSLSVDLKKSGDSYKFTDKSIEKLVKTALLNYMEPYDTVCDVLNIGNFLQSFLDASFKGDVTQFSNHTGQTPEQLLAWYEESFTNIPAELSESQKARYVDALKNILKQCQYTVGIPLKNKEAYSYTVTVSFKPNTSITEALNTAQNSTYYSMSEAVEGAVQTLETYASAPVFGAETSQTITLSISSLLAAGEENSELSNLCLAICQIPQ